MSRMSSWCPEPITIAARSRRTRSICCRLIVLNALRRIKITDIFKEVGRRQSLRLKGSRGLIGRHVGPSASRQSQEKVRKFREDLHQRGFGPNASTGDADFFALGIGAATDSYEDDATPRRRCLLESLSLEVRHLCWHILWPSVP